MSANRDSNTFEAFWTGPFSWPNFEKSNGLPSLPKSPGVYLQTFEYKDGYLIYAAGITRRTFLARFREHTRNYLNGNYNVLDPLEAESGIRKEIWHGWSYSKTHRDQFEERKIEIQETVNEQLSRFRVFVADVGVQRRFLERIEASIMNHLDQQSTPYCDIPEKGMMLAPRWDDEEPMVIRNSSRSKLYGLPEYLEI